MLCDEKKQSSVRVSVLLWISSIISITLCYIDVVGVNLFGMNMRIGQAALPIIWAVIGFRFRVSIPELLSAIVLLIFLSWSILGSQEVAKSFTYLLWVMHSFGIVYLLFRDLSSRMQVDIEGALVAAARLQIAIAAILVILGVQQRGHVLFYEASYFAIAMVPYMAITVVRAMQNGMGSRLLDMCFLLCGLLVTQSATFIMAGFIVVALSMMMNRGVSYKVPAMIMIAAILLTGYLASAHFSDSLVGIFFSHVYSDPVGLISFLVERGGNRIPRIELGLDVWRAHPWLGVGVGAYESYINNLDVSHYAPLWWMSPAGLPVSSIYVELLATSGIFGLVGFVFFVSVVLRKIPFGSEYRWLWIAVMSTLVVLSIEGNYLRMYLWMLLGISAGIGARAHSQKQQVPPPSCL